MRLSSLLSSINGIAVDALFILPIDISEVFGGESIRGLKGVGDKINGTTRILGISDASNDINLSLISSSAIEFRFSETEIFVDLLSSLESS